jgi:hypothetical protein
LEDTLNNKNNERKEAITLDHKTMSARGTEQNRREVIGPCALEDDVHHARVLKIGALPGPKGMTLKQAALLVIWCKEDKPLLVLKGDGNLVMPCDG